MAGGKKSERILQVPNDLVIGGTEMVLSEIGTAIAAARSPLSLIHI